MKSWINCPEVGILITVNCRSECIKMQCMPSAAGPEQAPSVKALNEFFKQNYLHLLLHRTIYLIKKV